jgi:hypothetical protein
MKHVIKYQTSHDVGSTLLRITVNGRAVWLQTHNAGIHSDEAVFDCDYELDDSPILKLQFVNSGSKDQQPTTKQLKIESILIKNQPLEITTGQYNVHSNDWFNSQDGEYKKEHTIHHGGFMGWFGDMEFQFTVSKDKRSARLKSKNKSHGILGQTNKIIYP